MKFSRVASLATVVASVLAYPLERRANPTEVAYAEQTKVSSDGQLEVAYGQLSAVIEPKVFIISMFLFEAAPWLDYLDFKHNISLPGLSPMYPHVRCTLNYSVCGLTTGEGEINAASTITALGLSSLFDLTHTYFLISGIAGGEPNYTTMGSVTMPKYAIQVALEYEVAYQDFISTNSNWTSGYWAYGTKDPWSYAGTVYGTEVFELNENLIDRAAKLAGTATLQNGTEENFANRRLYTESAARGLPSVERCDTVTSDSYFTGKTLNEYFGAYAKMMTNGSATYCSSAQEDNASLEVFTRLHKHGLADYNRVVIMRSISDFTRPPASKANDTVSWFNLPQDGGSQLAFDNLPLAGMPFIEDVLENWEDVYYDGEDFEPENYTGDIFNTLGGTPDFGKPSFVVA